MTQQLPIVEAQPPIIVSEVFGPTYQGEGVELGRPALFVRLHGCPVHCPGCDTAYTWNGSEKGKPWTMDSLLGWIKTNAEQWPGCGMVLTGGEPLIHYRNLQLDSLLYEAKKVLKWMSLETSGYIGRKDFDRMPYEYSNFFSFFLSHFSTVHWSPKITPCLHGRYDDAELLINASRIFTIFANKPEKLALKFVVRDDEDVKAVMEFIREQERKANFPRRHRIFLMPYGIHRDEILKACDYLLPICARHGFDLSPRFHSILWGAKRGV